MIVPCLPVTTGSTIWHNRVQEDAPVAQEGHGFSTSEVSTTKVSAFIDRDSNNSSSSQVSVNERGAFQLGGLKVSSDESTMVKIGAKEVGFLQIGSVKIRTTQNAVTQISSLQDGTTQVNTTQIDSKGFSIIPVGPTHINSTQINPGEIPLTSSISLQQFLTSHNYTLQNTSIPTWLSYLGGTTPFNLNIEVTDLPTGQLAVACNV